MVNVVMLGGNLTADPELKYTPKGTAVANMRLAVNSRYTTATGEKREEVLFIDVVAWGRQAETCAEYLAKGSKVFVEGQLKSQEWDDRRTGQKMRKIEVHAKAVNFLSASKKTANGAAPASVPATAGAEPGDDDVPF